jgi:hypothetical protein
LDVAIALDPAASELYEERYTRATTFARKAETDGEEMVDSGANGSRIIPSSPSKMGLRRMIGAHGN